MQWIVTRSTSPSGFRRTTATTFHSTRSASSTSACLATLVVSRSADASYTHPLSPLTLLRTRTLFGRPRFDEIFPSLTEAIEKGSYLPGREASLRTKVGVYFCGVRSAHPLLSFGAPEANARPVSDLPAGSTRQGGQA